MVATRSWFCHQSTKCSMLGHGAVPPEHLVLGSPCLVCRCNSTPSGAGANPSSGGGSEEEEAEINEVFLREEVMIKTSRVEPHANIKGHRMSKYRKGLYNKFCHFVLKDGNQVETCILRLRSERITRVERGEVVALHGQQERQNCFQSPRWQRQDLSLITKS